MHRLRSVLARWRTTGPERETEGERPYPSPFIVGVGRSGTTMLRLMLDSHPELAIPSETHFIPRAFRACERAKNPHAAFYRATTTYRTWADHQIDEDEMRKRVAAIKPFDLGEALRVFYQMYAERFGKVRWGDKTPQYLRHMRLVSELLPEARFIHILRDGRDVALSTKDLWFGPDSVEENAKWWTSWIEDARRQSQYLEFYKEIRYEDLITDTETVLRETCAFLNLPYEASMLDYHQTAGDRMRELDWDVPASKKKPFVRGVDRTGIHSLTSEPPQKNRIGRWKKEMEEKDRERYENIAGDMLRELGYETG